MTDTDNIKYTKGTYYLIKITDLPKGSHWHFKMTNGGNNKEGNFLLGIHKPGQPKIKPILNLSKTKNHDFYVSHISTNQEDGIAEATVGVWPTPDNFKGFLIMHKAFLGLGKFTTMLGVYGADKTEERCKIVEFEDDNSDCIKRSHSPERAREQVDSKRANQHGSQANKDKEKDARKGPKHRI